MKRFIIGTTLTLCLCATALSQDNDEKVEFKVHLGVKYVPLEYKGGPSIASILLFPNGLNASLRKDFLIGIGSFDQGLTYRITDYYTYNYLDFGYRLADDKFTVGAGAGWVYKGEGENEIFDRTTGYYTVTTYATMRIQPFYLELRGDIPLGGNQRLINRGYLFPVSLCLSYRFPEK